MHSAEKPKVGAFGIVVLFKHNEPPACEARTLATRAKGGTIC